MAAALVAAPAARAQAPAEPQRVALAAAPPTYSLRSSHVQLLVGRSTLLNVGSPISRVSVTTPEIADAMVTAPDQLLVHGKTPGTISLLVWDRAGGVRSYEVAVQRDLSTLSEHLRELFPGDAIAVTGSGSDIVLSGVVSSTYVVEKAAQVAAGYVEKPENVVNLLRQEEVSASTQVMLKVRFAEVSRSALSELGASLFTGPDGRDGILGRTTTQQFPAPIFDEESGRTKLVFSDFLNLFLFDADEQLGAVVKALESKGLFQSLAEPNLIARNGTEASFLAGGEYPYPAVQAGANGLAITVAFKEFGIRLNFVPTIIRSGVIHLRVRPEVSALDFTNAVSIQGFRVPSLSTRRAETEVELRDGQTFAIAGLLNNTLTETMQKVPGLGDIPLLGALFRSRALQKAESELVVMISAQILERDAVGAASGLPALQKPFLERPDEALPPPPPVQLPVPPGGGQRPSAPPAADPPLEGAGPAATAFDASPQAAWRPQLSSSSLATFANLPAAGSANALAFPRSITVSVRGASGRPAASGSRLRDAADRARRRVTADAGGARRGRSGMVAPRLTLSPLLEAIAAVQRTPDVPMLASAGRVGF